MPVAHLSIDAECENIKEIRVPENFQWQIDVCDGQNPSEVRENVSFNTLDECTIPNTNKTCHVVMNLGGSKKAGYIVSLESKDSLDPNLDDDILHKFETRGIQIVKFHARRGFIVVSSSNTVYDDVDLSEDWCEYDEKLGATVSILDVAGTVTTK